MDFNILCMVSNKSRSKKTSTGHRTPSLPYLLSYNYSFFALGFLSQELSWIFTHSYHYKNWKYNAISTCLANISDAVRTPQSIFFWLLRVEDSRLCIFCALLKLSLRILWIIIKKSASALLEWTTCKSKYLFGNEPYIFPPC